MIAFSYVNFPTIPNELLKDVYASVDDDIPLVDLPFKKYKLLTCRKPIQDYVSSFFDKPIFCGVQTIISSQGVHIDYKRTVVYNYIIETGGSNVITNFYVDLNKSKKIESVCIEPLKWHRLQVIIPHEVDGITGKRIAITAWKK